MFEDLNEVLNANKKIGGIGIWKKRLFLKYFMQELGAIDLGFYGRRFTWENGQQVNASIKEKIVSKIITNRMINIIDRIVSPQQRCQGSLDSREYSGGSRAHLQTQET